MAQLMGQGHYISQLAVEIGQNAALTQTLDSGAEGTASLAAAGEEIDPGFVKGPGDHVRLLGVKAPEQLHQIIPGIFRGETGGGLAHGGKEVIPGQAILMAQSLGFGLQILPEFGQVLVNGAEHSLQRCPLHV